MKLNDCQNNIINENDIVIFENLQLNDISYYLYSENMLYKYDNLGKIHTDKLGNIKIDSGVELINNDTIKWTKLGTKEEIYSTIFDK